MSDREVARELLDRVAERDAMLQMDVPARIELMHVLGALPLEKMRDAIPEDEREIIVEIFARTLAEKVQARTYPQALAVVIAAGAVISREERLSAGVREIISRDCLYCGYPISGGGTGNFSGEPSPGASQP